MKTCTNKSVRSLAIPYLWFVAKLIFISKRILNLILSVSIFIAQPTLAQLNDKSFAKKRSGQDKAIMIGNLNEIAELEFLDGDLTKAKETYTQITNLALDEAWSDETRNIIFISYFRLAQIDKVDEKIWVQKAFAFSSDLEPSAKTTPQHLIKLFTEIKSSENVVHLKLDNLHDKTINGSKSLTSVYKNKLYRIDILNVDQKPSTHFVRGEEIENFKAQPDKQNVAHVQSLPVELPKKIVKQISYTQPLSQSIAEKQDIHFISEDQIAKGHSSSPIKKSVKSNRWVYIASTALAVTLGAVLISNNNDKPKTYEATRIQGF